MAHRAVIVLVACTLPGVCAADYVGTLRVPQSTLAPVTQMFSLSRSPSFNGMAAENGVRLRLGYKYSRYFAIEGEVADFGRAADPFVRPGNLASTFRSTGFGVDTVATLPIWGFALYGRFGAYRGDARGGFAWNLAPYSESAYSRTTRLRYGLGLRYDFTKSLRIRAELERHSPLHAPLLTEVDAGDQVSVGVSWRF